MNKRTKRTLAGIAGITMNFLERLEEARATVKPRQDACWRTGPAVELEIFRLVQEHYPAQVEEWVETNYETLRRIHEVTGPPPPGLRGGYEKEATEAQEVSLEERPGVVSDFGARIRRVS